MNNPAKERYPAPFPCLVCGRDLENLVHPESVPNQPLEACTFNSRGHYGCTVFDEMDGAKIEINVCDPCLVAAREQKRVGYWPGYPRRKLSLWHGDE